MADKYGPQLNFVAPNLVNLAVNTETCRWSFASNFSESVHIFLFALENSGTWEVVRGDKFITSALTLFITSGGNAIVSVAAPSLLQLSITTITNIDTCIDTWILSSTVSEAVSASRFVLENSGTCNIFVRCHRAPEVVQEGFITSDLTLFISSGGNAIVSVAAPSLLQLSIDTTLTNSWSLSSALREQVSGSTMGFNNTGKCGQLASIWQEVL
jgi:hypothetical protein